MNAWQFLEVADHYKLFMPVVNISLEQFDVIDNEPRRLTAARIVPLSLSPKSAGDVRDWLTFAFGKDANIEVETVTFSPKGNFYDLNLRHIVKDNVMEVRV